MKKSEKYFNGLLEGMQERHEKSQEDILAQMVEVQRSKLATQDKIEEYLEKLGVKREVKVEVGVDW